MKIKIAFRDLFALTLSLGGDFRSKAHDAFDPLWKSGFFKSRNAAYRWLASEMGISRGDCHFSLFGKDECERAIKICNNLKGGRHDCS